jgi:DNA-binding NarL/FixJ family response regulator
MKIRVLMIDDHTLFLAGLEDILAREEDIEVVGVAGSCREGVPLALEKRPDVIVLDLAMPETSGVEAARIIAAALPGVRMAALTMHLDRQMVFEALKSGMTGYILKEATPEEFLFALRVVARGETWLSPKVATLVANDFVRGSAPEAPSAPALSEREQEVLRHLVKGAGAREIAATLHISKSTVDTHRRNILDKLGCENVTCLTRYALRHGLVDLDE